MRSLEIAVAVFPDRPRAHWRLADAHVRAGRLDDAMAALGRATALGPVDLGRLRTDPAWQPLRQRPAWAELIATLAGEPPASG